MIQPWCDPTDTDYAQSPYVDEAIKAASFVLWSLAGRKYNGQNTVTEQYMCETTGAPVGCFWDPGVRGYWNPSIGSYTFIEPSVTGARFAAGNSIRLRRTPVREIVSITIDGAEVTLGSYMIRNGAILSTSAGWSLCDGPLITYKYGVPPPEMGRQAAITLANEFVALWTPGEKACRLPERTQSVSRQGISIEMYDPADFLDKGRTGVYEVDLFIAAVNPLRALKRAKTFSPDLPYGYTLS